ncbi:hypothetical protein GCM10023063_30040 [Arthrobacter methylotrophus]
MAPSLAACKSTPRCPLCQGLSGGSKLRMTVGLGDSGHTQSGRVLAEAAEPEFGAAPAGAVPNARTTSRWPRRFTILMDQALASSVGTESGTFGYVEKRSENSGNIEGKPHASRS